MSAVNGSEKSAVQIAQERLVAAIGTQGLDLPSAAFSGYANAVVASVRVSAICQLLVEAGILPKVNEGFGSVEYELDRLITAKLNDAAQAMEERARQPKIAVAGRP